MKLTPNFYRDRLNVPGGKDNAREIYDAAEGHVPGRRALQKLSGRQRGGRYATTRS